jgi:hypothetical protein
MRRSFYTVLISVMCAVWHNPLWADDSLCHTGEETIFSCPVGRGKTVSVCATELKKSQFQVQYRFGHINQPELLLPENPIEYVKYVEGNQSSGARGGDSFIRFKSGEYSYTVRDLWGAPATDGTGCTPKSCSNIGIIVEKAGALISRKDCTGLASPFKEGFLSRYDIPISDNWPE